MTEFKHERRSEYTDFATVESQRNDLTAEEFSEGSYGSEEPAKLGKSTPWRVDQRPPNRFTYENRELHEGLMRHDPASHPTHDEEQDEQHFTP